MSPTNNERCEGVRWKLFGLLFQLLASGKCSTEDYCRTRSTGRRKHPRQHDPVIASVCVWLFVCCATIRFWLFRPRCISPRAPGHTWADGATHDGWRVIHELWEQLHSSRNLKRPKWYFWVVYGWPPSSNLKCKRWCSDVCSIQSMVPETVESRTVQLTKPPSGSKQS